MVCPKRRRAGQSEVGPGWIMVWAVYVMEVPGREGKAVSIRGDNASVVQWILE